MESNFDPVLVRDKFSSLIARLHEIGFSDDLITSKIMDDPFFDCFENNNYLILLKYSTEEIIANVFDKKNVIIDYNKPLVSEYVWAGNMYFLLLNDHHIPLERLLLIWPLSLMIEKYNPYHEMPSNSLHEDYKRDESRINLFKQLKNRSGLSISKISILTGISENTLKSYLRDDRIFDASFENICSLLKALKIKPSVFKKRSSFVMVSDYLLSDKNFLSRFKEAMARYFNVNKDVQLIETYKNNSELVALAKEYKVYIYLPDFALVKYTRTLEYIFLNDNEINMLASMCL